LSCRLATGRGRRIHSIGLLTQLSIPFRFFLAPTGHSALKLLAYPAAEAEKFTKVYQEGDFKTFFD
jgi:hypothetical protein